MAFSSNVLKPVSDFDRFTGFADSNVLAVNPDGNELKEIYGSKNDIENPAYTSTSDVNGVPVKTVRIDFIVKPNAGANLISRVSFYIRRAYRTSNDGKKCQVIDKYGNSAWVTEEQFKNHEIPTTSDGRSILISKDYKKAYSGEADLIEFIKIYRRIKSAFKDGELKSESELEECKAYFENIDEFFNGNFKELKDIIIKDETGIVKVLYGVKMTDNGIYQTTFNVVAPSGDPIRSKFVYNRMQKIIKQITESRERGSLLNTSFTFGDLTKYEVSPSTVEPTLAQNETAVSDIPAMGGTVQDIKDAFEEQFPF